jgi:hypothetical protein
MQEIKSRKTGETLYWNNVTWQELTPAQQHDVMYGGACGHPSNRPRDEAQARRWLYTLTPDKSKIQGIIVGGFTTAGTYRDR